MEIKFTRRKENDDILHCRFCKDSEGFGVKLYETSPVRGIVCENCKKHLEDYIIVDQPNQE